MADYFVAEQQGSATDADYEQYKNVMKYALNDFAFDDGRLPFVFVLTVERPFVSHVQFFDRDDWYFALPEEEVPEEDDCLSDASTECGGESPVLGFAADLTDF